MADAGTGDVAVSKTVYDPCPPGYCIPRRNAYTGFTTTGINCSSYVSYSDYNVADMTCDGIISREDFTIFEGWYFYTNPSKTATFFFPAAGGRSYQGEVSVGNGGKYWTAGRQNTSRAISLYFTRNSLSPLGTTIPSTDANSVRAVEE